MGVIDNKRASKGRGGDYEELKEGAHLRGREEPRAVRCPRGEMSPLSRVREVALRGSPAREGEQRAEPVDHPPGSGRGHRNTTTPGHPLG